MGLVEVRPDITHTAGFGWQASPACGGSWVGDCAHIRIADDNTDAITFLHDHESGTFSQPLEVGFQNPVIPPGARIRRVRVRTLYSGAFDVGEAQVRSRSQVDSTFTPYHEQSHATHGSAFGNFSGTWRTSRPGGGEWSIPDVNGFRVNFRVRRTQDFGGGGAGLTLRRVFADIEYNEPPEVEVLGPTGIIDDTSTPTISWDYSSPDGNPQEAFRVVVRNSVNDVIHDSGKVLSSNTSYTLPSLTNDNYVAEVVVYQEWGHGDFSSDPDTTSFEVQVIPPAIPEINLTPSNEKGGSISVVISDPEYPSGNDLAEYIQVQWSDNLEIWNSPRQGSFFEVVEGEISFVDWEVPPNKPRYYRARSLIIVQEDVFSQWSTPVSASTEVTRWWIKDPRNPEESALLVKRVEGVIQRTRRTRSSVHYGLGSEHPTVLSSLPTSGIFHQSFLVTSEEEFLGLSRLINLSTDLLMITPRGQWYVRVTGDIQENWDHHQDPGFYVVIGLELTEVARPDFVLEGE